MASLELDDGLLEAAMAAGNHQSKEEAVTAALKEYVRLQKRLRLLDLFGTIDYDPAYDYKAERQKRRHTEG